MRILISYLIGDLGASHIGGHEQLLGPLHPLSNEVFDKRNSHLLGKYGRKMIGRDIGNRGYRIQGYIFLIEVLIYIFYCFMQYLSVFFSASGIPYLDHLFKAVLKKIQRVLPASHLF